MGGGSSWKRLDYWRWSLPRTVTDEACKLSNSSVIQSDLFFVLLYKRQVLFRAICYVVDKQVRPSGTS